MCIKGQHSKATNQSMNYRVGVVSVIFVISLIFSSAAAAERCDSQTVKTGIIANQIILEKNPGDRNARLDLAKCYLIKNELNSVENQVDILLQNNADDVIVLLLQAFVFYRKQEWQSAKDIYLRTIELDPQNPEPYYVLANIYTTLNDLENAKWYSEQHKILVGNQ